MIFEDSIHYRQLKREYLNYSLLFFDFFSYFYYNNDVKSDSLVIKFLSCLRMAERELYYVRH